jgi:putative membrane protein
MVRFALRVLLAMAGLWIATQIIPGVAVAKPLDLLWAALVLGVVNALVRPLAVLLTLPITFLTLGLFLLVINAAMLGLTAWLLDGFTVGGFFGALGAWLVVSLVSWIGGWFIADKSDRTKPA